MLNFPQPPDTLVTRQLECISCKHIFTIAEDRPSRWQRRTQHWQMPANDDSNTELRFLPNRTQRAIRPDVLSFPDRTPASIFNETRSRRAAVTCPRCGADNRNWLWLSRRTWRYTIGPILLLVAFFFVAAYFGWLQPTPFRWGILFLAAITPILLINVNWRTIRENQHLRRLVPSGRRLPPQLWAVAGIIFLLAVVLPLAVNVALPFLFDVSLPQLFAPEEPPPTLVERIDQVHVALGPKINERNPEDLIPIENALASLQNLVIPVTVNCSFVKIDEILFNLNLLKTDSYPPSRSVIIDQVMVDLKSIRDQENCQSERLNIILLNMEALLALEAQCRSMCAQQQETNDLLAAIINDMQLLDLTPPTPGSPLENSNGIIQAARMLVVSTPDIATQQRIANEIAALEMAIAVDDTPFITLEIQTVLREWATSIFAVGGLATLVAALSTNMCIAWVDRNVPRPIFFSIADMTRVVLWDTIHSLEIQGDFNHIQWTSVDRDLNGGIILCGVHRDRSQTNFEQGVLQLVHAQRYKIYTDAWARIESATVRQILVPPAWQSDGDATIEEQFFQNVPPTLSPRRERPHISA